MIRRRSRTPKTYIDIVAPLSNIVGELDDLQKRNSVANDVDAEVAAQAALRIELRTRENARAFSTENQIRALIS